ncbi:MAG TPA: ABC transporter ATP-binding protein [Dehalococcoidia bacterium]|nr:ABC transporter ATP-binding protein [Dehalococcoidia bacterium]
MAPFFEVRDLRTHLFTRRGVVKAVDGISFSLERGETLGIVGESGSGKSMTLLSILGLVPYPAGRIVGGEIRLEGRNLLELSEADLREVRGQRISMIPQDPMTSLNPVLRCGDQIMEPLRVHRRLTGPALRERAAEMLRLVRIPEPLRRLRSYPHEMSGGMRQRVVGAVVLSCGPDLILADEPTTALDVTIQAQYLKLLKDIQAEQNLAMIFVTHDLGIISRMCDRVAVMYAGRIVEEANTWDLFDRPAHPYTRALLAAIPRADRDVDRLQAIEGQPPELHNLPPGCPFAPRCLLATDRCREEFPPEVIVGAGHRASCWEVGR